MTPIDETVAPGNTLSDQHTGPQAALDLMLDIPDAAASRTSEGPMAFISRKPMTALLASMAVGAGTIALATRRARSASLPVHRSAPEQVEQSKRIWPAIAAGIVGAWLGSRSGRKA